LHADSRKVAAVFGMAILAFVAGYLLFNNVLLGALGFAIILGSTAEYWLGTSYKVDQRGATARCGLSVTSLPWNEVKRVVEGQETVKLSPLAEAGKLDPFRGVTLRFAAGNREAVMQAVRRFVGDDVRFLEG
jgi:hypothetical protein